MNTIELQGPKELIKKRKKVFSTLNLEEVAALKASRNAEQVAQDFDRIFLKLCRLIKYSTAKNESEKSEIEKQTNNLLRKFTNYLSKKTLDKKMEYEQKAFFDDVCSFINFFVDDTYLSVVHNSLPKTSLEDFNKKSVGNQLFQNMHARNWGIKGIAEGGSCSYRTILLYNFFNKLKEAGLDIKISFFRFKNLDDNILGQIPSQRHSGLIVNFQGADYMVDHDGIIYDRNERIARPISAFLDISEKAQREDCKVFFENFKHGNMQETDEIKFFDNVNDFIKHCEQYPEHRKISFYVKFPRKKDVEKVIYEFGKMSFGISINGEMHEFYLKDNKLQPNDFIKTLIKKSFVKRVGNDFVPITESDIEMLEKYLDLLKNKINTDTLHKNYTTGKSREAAIVNRNGKNRIAMMEK